MICLNFLLPEKGEMFVCSLGSPSAVKYYFAEFVRKGGRVPPKSVTPFSMKILSVKGGGGVPPKSVTYFLDQNQVFFEQKHNF